MTHFLASEQCQIVAPVDARVPRLKRSCSFSPLPALMCGLVTNRIISRILRKVCPANPYCGHTTEANYKISPNWASVTWGAEVLVTRCGAIEK